MAVSSFFHYLHVFFVSRLLICSMHCITHTTSSCAVIPRQAPLFTHQVLLRYSSLLRSDVTRLVYRGVGLVVASVSAVDVPAAEGDEGNEGHDGGKGNPAREGDEGGAVG